MIKVEAFIRPQKLDDVTAALHEIGVYAMSISDIRGAGKQKGITQHYRGTEYTVNLLPKTKIEIVAPDEQAHQIAEIIAEKAQTGEIGDGKIFLYPVTEAVRIRTGETGDIAVS